MESSRTKIRSFIAQSFTTVDLREDEDIFALGFINSLFAMQLVLFVESEFGIALDNEDLDIDNFRTIDAIAGLIGRKTNAAWVESEGSV